MTRMQGNPTPESDDTRLADLCTFKVLSLLSFFCARFMLEA